MPMNAFFFLAKNKPDRICFFTENRESKNGQINSCGAQHVKLFVVHRSDAVYSIPFTCGWTRIS